MNHAINDHKVIGDNGSTSSQPFCIAMVSDMFYPDSGGVETHIYNLAQCLIARGHKVIMITFARDGSNRRGIRYMEQGLKVYYLPVYYIETANGKASLYTFTTLWPYFYKIMVRERVELVHGHQTASAMASECLVHAQTMGIRTVFSDHSLFGLGGMDDIHANKSLKYTVTNVDHIVCPSHTSKENIVLRCRVLPEKVSVIAHAVDNNMFYPDMAVREQQQLKQKLEGKQTITIVTITRLTYRKGVDLLIKVIPLVCKAYPNVKFLVAGDGPKRLQFKEMLESNPDVAERVKWLGKIPFTQVPKELNKGDIFLSCSLTESFGIAILEAASCGLFIVSTNVGAVKEILPEDMMLLTTLDPIDIAEGIKTAIEKHLDHSDPQLFHQRVRRMYNWASVAQRTEVVYSRILTSDQPSSTLAERLERYNGCGTFFGKLCIALNIIDYMIYRFLEFWFPRELIETSVDMCAAFRRREKSREVKGVNKEESGGVSELSEGTNVTKE